MPLNQLGNQEVSQLKKQFDVESVEARIERLEKAVSNLTRSFLIHMPCELGRTRGRYVMKNGMTVIEDCLA